VAEEAGFPLVFLTPSSRAWQTSQLPEPAQSDAPVCTVHPDAAAPLGLGDGDPAVVQSPLGRLAVQLRLDPRLHPDACVVHRGGWLRHGRAVNTLVQAAATDLGEGAALYDQRVRLIRCARRQARPATPSATPGHTKA
jgi:anaerobic selenocysteine-containing dehydrogenase